jgi:uncharacterized membrane protein
VKIGFLVLIAVVVLIYLGFAQRALDRLRLSDRAALLFLAAMIIGGFLPDIPLGANTSINIGGGVIPLILVVYLWSKAERFEMNRSFLAVLITTGVVFASMKILPVEPTYNFILDPLYIIAIVAGLVGYLSGRSRRGAFIAGTMAIILNDVISQAENVFSGIRSPLVIGGAGVFDAVVIAGFIALGLAEIVGETAEKITLGMEGQEDNISSRKDTEAENPEMDNAPEDNN